MSRRPTSRIQPSMSPEIIPSSQMKHSMCLKMDQEVPVECGHQKRGHDQKKLLKVQEMVNFRNGLITSLIRIVTGDSRFDDEFARIKTLFDVVAAEVKSHAI